LGQGIDALGTEVRDEAGCARFLARAGDRYPAVAKRANRPDAVEALARCSAQLGLTVRARQLYRILITDYGVDGAVRGLLPLAELELAAGRTAQARKYLDAQARLRRPESAAAIRLALLRGELALVEGRPRETVARLLPLLQRDLSREQSAVALANLARAGHALPDAKPVRDALELRLQSMPLAVGTHVKLGEAALATASLLEAAGETTRAGALLSRAEHWLPPGPRRAEASYRLAVLALDPVAAGLAFDTAKDTRDAGAWSRLADAGRSAIRARAALEEGEDAKTQ
jgi:hypothetical protein